MVKLAIPNKGALSEKAITILTEAGYKCKRSGRELNIYDIANDISFFFLRPRDIAVYVANGTLDLGITGRDLALDSTTGVHELLPLNFGKSSFYYAIPNNINKTPDDFHGMRIATSYKEIVLEDLKNRNIKGASVVRLDGAVEISIQLGVADAIADVVESGKTLKEAGLKTVGEPVLSSEAILISRDASLSECSDVSRIIKRLKGILLAREYSLIEYDIPKLLLSDACQVTPGFESPTISPLNNKQWVAIKSMIKHNSVNTVMDKLQDLGAKGIIITQIKTCRL